MEISLKTDRIYVVDKGVVKRVKYAGRTLLEVLEEIQRFAYLRGFNTPTTILKFIMKRIGLPDVDVFPSDDDLTKEDVLEFSRALNIIESLKDEFLSPLGTAKVSDELKNVLTKVSEEPEMPEAPAEEVPAAKKPSIWDDVPQSEEVTKLIYSFHSENLPVNTPTPRTDSKAESDPSRKKFVWDEPAEMEAMEDLVPEEEMVHAEEMTATTDDGLLQLKVLFLGEQQVGVKSILFECNLKLGQHDESLGSSSEKPFIYSNVVSHDDQNIQVNVWSFEKTMEARVPRTDFFTGAGAAVIVYSVADRWSFESLDFWIKELTTTFLIPPPIVVVGNKTDLRDHPVYGEEEEFDVPVTTEEGQAFCEQIAKQIGHDGQRHPLFFVETSSVTGQGITELLEKLIDLWIINERPSMPAVETDVIKR
jgi:GTPase SAR1 family protein